MKQNKCGAEPKAEVKEPVISKSRCNGGKIKNNMPDGRVGGKSPCKDAIDE